MSLEAQRHLFSTRHATAYLESDLTLPLHSIKDISTSLHAQYTALCPSTTSKRLYATEDWDTRPPSINHNQNSRGWLKLVLGTKERIPAWEHERIERLNVYSIPNKTHVTLKKGTRICRGMVFLEKDKTIVVERGVSQADRKARKEDVLMAMKQKLGIKERERPAEGVGEAELQENQGGEGNGVEEVDLDDWDEGEEFDATQVLVNGKDDEAVDDWDAGEEFDATQNATAASKGAVQDATHISRIPGQNHERRLNNGITNTNTRTLPEQNGTNVRQMEDNDLDILLDSSAEEFIAPTQSQREPQAFMDMTSDNVPSSSSNRDAEKADRDIKVEVDKADGAEAMEDVIVIESGSFDLPASPKPTMPASDVVAATPEHSSDNERPHLTQSTVTYPLCTILSLADSYTYINFQTPNPPTVHNLPCHPDIIADALNIPIIKLPETHGELTQMKTDSREEYSVLGDLFFGWWRITVGGGAVVGMEVVE